MDPDESVLLKHHGTVHLLEYFIFRKSFCPNVFLDLVDLECDMSTKNEVNLVNYASFLVSSENFSPEVYDCSSFSWL